MRKNLIDFIVVPIEDKSVNLNQLASIKEFFKDFELNTSLNWYNFTNDNMEISISNTSIIMISLRIPSEDTEDAIIALSQLSEKIRYLISLKKFLIHIYVLEIRKVNLKEYNELSLEPNPDFKITCYDKETIIQFKNYNSINDIINLYPVILGNETVAIK